MNRSYLLGLFGYLVFVGVAGAGCGPFVNANGETVPGTQGTVFSERHGTDLSSHVKLPADSEWHIQQDIFFEGQNAKVTIGEGATLRFEKNVGLAVQRKAAIEVNGTAENPVTFTGTKKQKGWWGGIGMWKSRRSSNSISHARIAYGGRAEWDENPANLLLESDGGHGVDISLDNVVFESSGTAGLHVDIDSNLRSCSNVTFADNPIKISSREESRKAEAMSQCGL